MQRDPLASSRSDRAGCDSNEADSGCDVHVELFAGAGGTALGLARALNPAGITVWTVEKAEKRHARNPFAWFTGDWREGLDRALQTGRVVSLSGGPPCTKNTAGTRALRSREGDGRYRDDPDLENVREAFEETGLPWLIENVESEVSKRKMRDPLRLCGSEFDLQADDPATGLRLWLKRHRLFEANFPIWGAGGCRHPKGLRCAGAYGGARRNEVEARTIRKGGYVPSVEVVRELLGAPPWMIESDLFLSIPPAYGEHLGLILRDHLARAVAA